MIITIKHKNNEVYEKEVDFEYLWLKDAILILLEVFPDLEESRDSKKLRYVNYNKNCRLKFKSKKEKENFWKSVKFLREMGWL